MIYKILDRLFISDMQFSKADLKAKDIGYIINLCGSKTGLENKHIHLADDDTNPDFLIHSALTELEQKIAQGNIVLVHCREGRSRSSFIVASYLEHIGFKWENALAFVAERNPLMRIDLLLLKTHDQSFM